MARAKTPNRTPPSGGAPLDERQRALRAGFAGTCIHPETFLATDYLNHFNEVIMMLEMVPFIPEMLDEAEAWQPRSYEEHFRAVQLGESELAIEAYEMAPPAHRQQFDRLVAGLDALIPATIDNFGRLMDHPGALLEAFPPAMDRIRQMRDRLSDAIYGELPTLGQDSIDRLFR